MRQRPKTPKEIAKESDKHTYSVSLNRERANELKHVADTAGVPFSHLVDEAIKAYLVQIKVSNRR